MTLIRKFKRFAKVTTSNDDRLTWFEFKVCVKEIWRQKIQPTINGIILAVGMFLLLAACIESWIRLMEFK